LFNVVCIYENLIHGATTFMKDTTLNFAIYMSKLTHYSSIRNLSSIVFVQYCVSPDPYSLFYSYIESYNSKYIKTSFIGKLECIPTTFIKTQTSNYIIIRLNINNYSSTLNLSSTMSVWTIT